MPNDAGKEVVSPIAMPSQSLPPLRCERCVAPASQLIDAREGVVTSPELNLVGLPIYSSYDVTPALVPSLMSPTTLRHNGGDRVVGLPVGTFIYIVGWLLGSWRVPPRHRQVNESTFTEVDLFINRQKSGNGSML